MIFPCPQKIDCPPQGNLDYDFPLANLTSEQPDHEIFIGMAWGPLDAGGSQPPLGSIWRATGCAFVCQSIISQADADLCAQQQAALCTWNQWDPGHPPPTHGGSGGTPTPVIYTNALAQCSAGCPDGSLFTWTILAGTYFALSQALADEIAQSVACQKALTFFFCLGDLTSTAQTGQAYSSTAVITGNNHGPFTAQIISGSLPNGLQMFQGQRSVIVSGTPTKPGAFTFTIQLQDSAGNFMQKTFTITVKTSCSDFWSGLVGQWQLASGGGPASSATASATQVVLSADQPFLGFGFAQAAIPSTAPTPQEFDCALTLIPVQASGITSPANVNFQILIQDATTAAVYLSLNFNGNNLPLASSYPFTLPPGARVQITFQITITLNGTNPGDHTILAYNIQLG